MTSLSAKFISEKYLEYFENREKILDARLRDLESAQIKRRSENQFYGLKLHENIATIICQHQLVVEAHYGPDKMIRVIERHQEECDRQDTRLTCKRYTLALRYF
ncbi:hypothetical protein Glove_655g9 [Diversispora epigaea]|uniref:COG4 transport protein middle alpha-helical bundle domain-containing protein n=1 Tax=Diversispora epigaea TaxID=1348612 RepID=A0A397G8R6_9GLOM|nr:hypothetical protein Glove_655g9 [Diversispora epigaea]